MANFIIEEAFFSMLVVRHVNYSQGHPSLKLWAETWHWVWSRRKEKFLGANFRMTFIRKNFHFTPKNFWWPFLVIDCTLSVSDPFSPKTSISPPAIPPQDLSLVSTYFASQNVSKYWGDGCISRPPPQICFKETVPQVPLKSPPVPLANGAHCIFPVIPKN